MKWVLTYNIFPVMAVPTGNVPRNLLPKTHPGVEPLFPVPAGFPPIIIIAYTAKTFALRAN